MRRMFVPVLLAALVAVFGMAKPGAALASEQARNVRGFEVPAGATLHEIRALVAKADGLGGDVPERLMEEGWLAPGGYSLRPGMTRGELVETMRGAQEGRLSAAWDYRAPGLPVATPGELLALASLVECEAPSSDFYGLVASVLVNRLKLGIALQVDTPLRYGITGGDPALDRPLTQGDLAADTPWNLYRNAGLPPGPVCAPSLEALAVTAHPPETDLLYFVSDGAGGLRFAATLAEHNANVRLYREAVRAE